MRVKKVISSNLGCSHEILFIYFCLCHFDLVPHLFFSLNIISKYQADIPFPDWDCLFQSFKTTHTLHSTPELTELTAFYYVVHNINYCRCK